MSTRGRSLRPHARCVVLSFGAFWTAGTLSGCALTLTAAAGKDARAAIQCEVAQQPVGVKTRETTKFDDKIGFKPQVEEVTTVTTPAVPEAPPAHESKGSDAGEGIAGVFRGLGQFFRALVPW